MRLKYISYIYIDANTCHAIVIYVGKALPFQSPAPSSCFAALQKEQSRELDEIRKDEILCFAVDLLGGRERREEKDRVVLVLADFALSLSLSLDIKGIVKWRKWMLPCERESVEKRRDRS